MLLKFALFFITFGLSFVVQHVGWTDQGTAFVWIDIGATTLLIVFTILICLLAGSGLGEKLGLSFVIAVLYAIELAITLFATWASTKLFPVDFAVAFQIMSFGQCLCRSGSKKNNE